MPKVNKRKFSKGLYGTARAAGQVMWNNRKAITKAALQHWRKRMGTKRRKTTKLNMITSATGMTNSHHRITYKQNKQAKFYKTVGNVSTHQQIDTFGCTSLIRQQGVHDIACFGHGTTGIGVNGPLISTLFNTAQLNAAGDSSTGVVWTASNVTQGYKVMLDSFHQEIVVTNQSQCDVKVILYLCMSKTSSASSTPRTDWQDGLADNRAGLGLAAVQQFPGARPFCSKQFNMNWKVVKKQDILMGSGATHIHNENVKLNRIIDMEYADTFTKIRGITYCWMLICQGQIASGADSNNINYAPTELITAVTTTCKTRLVSSNARNIAQVDNQEGAQTSLRFVDKVSGAVEDLLVAATVVAGGAA